MQTLSVLFVALLGGAVSVLGANFSTNPGSDALVAAGPSGNLGNNNYGGAGSVSLAAPGLAQGELQSVLQFNLAGALTLFNSQFGVGQWSISAVTLQLTPAAANNAIFNSPAAGVFGISWMQNDSWQEGTGTPTAPGTSGITFNSLQSSFIGAGDERLGTFSFNGAVSGANSYALGLTPGFTADLLAGSDISLRLFGDDTSVSGVFNSRSFTTTANRPLLTVVAVPEPGSLTLAGLGLLLLTAWKLVHQRKD